jgi:hypothetical protein
MSQSRRGLADRFRAVHPTAEVRFLVLLGRSRDRLGRSAKGSIAVHLMRLDSRTPPPTNLRRAGPGKSQAAGQLWAATEKGNCRQK